MTEREIRGYHEEIDYQKRMLSNLQRFMTLSVLFSTTGIVLIYFFHSLSLLITILGIILLVIGVISSLVFGYGIYKGQKNIDNLINIFKEKLNEKRKGRIIYYSSSSFFSLFFFFLLIFTIMAQIIMTTSTEADEI